MHKKVERYYVGECRFFKVKTLRWECIWRESVLFCQNFDITGCFVMYVLCIFKKIFGVRKK